ncbi:MAG: 1,4-alpha-glucan branching protein domain-containing protein [Nitrospiria bacterium]
MIAPTGYLCLILHAHLPFVRHPEYDDFLEENWLYEAITDTYLPLLEVCHRLDADGVRGRFTMTLTPSLLAMFADPLLRTRYVRYLTRRIALATAEERRLRHDPQFGPLAAYYRDRFTRIHEAFVHRYRQDLTAAFAGLQERGRIEIITCGATHGFLPLLAPVPSAVRAQLRVAVDHYRRTFGRSPRGIWLPECAYTPGLDAMLRDEDLRFFILESPGLLYGRPSPRFGVHAPVYCPSGVAAFGRDAESSKQVWSAEEGYPGDPAYREYYRDAGFDLDADMLRGHLAGDGTRVNTGLKYYRITGPTDQKAPYDPARASAKAAEHAAHFAEQRRRQVARLAGEMDRPPLIVAPYDAELFGHWWFEGPQWVENLLRRLHQDGDLHAITPDDYLARHPTNQVVEPAASSWGQNGSYEVWLNGANDWIYRHLHHASRRMDALRARETAGIERRAVAQALRELLLAQASDWAFIMKTGTMVPYAVKRTTDHLTRFTTLYHQVTEQRLDARGLAEIEDRDTCFTAADLDRSLRPATAASHQEPAG